MSAPALNLTPNWSAPVIERLTWRTAVSTARSGLETRQPRRVLPDAVLEATYLVQGAQRGALESALAADEVCALPWAPAKIERTYPPDAAPSPVTPSAVLPLAPVDAYTLGSAYDSYLSTTRTRLLFRDSAGVALSDEVRGGVAGGFVDNFNTSWNFVPDFGNFTGADAVEAYPLVSGRFADSRLTYLTDDVLEARLAFHADVFFERPELSGTPGFVSEGEIHAPGALTKHNWVNSFDVANDHAGLDFETSTRKRRHPLFSKQVRTARLTLHGLANLQAFRRFLYTVKGRCNSFLGYLPGDTEATRYRLAQDTVEIAWLTTELAEVSLSITSVTA